MDDDNHNLYEFSSTLDPVKTLHGLLDDAQEEKVKAKKRLEASNASVAIMEKLLTYYNNKWPTHLYSLIDNNEEYFENLKRAHTESSELVETLYLDAKEESMKMLRRFPAHFEKACIKAEIDIDPTSRHPRYRVCQSFLEVEVSDKSSTVRVFDREGTLDKMPCDIGAIIDSLQFHKNRLFGCKLDSTKELARIYKQYKAIIKKEKMSEGESLPIRHITTRMGKNIKGFRTDKFLVDISQLIRNGYLEINDHRMDFQQTKNSKQGMLLHGLESRGYIGFITFKRVQSNETDSN